MLFCLRTSLSLSLSLLVVVHPVDQGAQTQLLPWSQAGSHRVPLCQAGAHQGLPQGRPGRLGQKAHWARPVHPELLRESRDQGISLTPHSSSPRPRPEKQESPLLTTSPQRHLPPSHVSARTCTLYLWKQTCVNSKKPSTAHHAHSREDLTASPLIHVDFCPFYSDFKGWCFFSSYSFSVLKLESMVFVFSERCF